MKRAQGEVVKDEESEFFKMTMKVRWWILMKK
jgi:hypothetical protein